MRFQGAILRQIAGLRGEPYRLATPEEEAQGIDGHVGNNPVSMKPVTIRAKKCCQKKSLSK